MARPLAQPQCDLARDFDLTEKIAPDRTRLKSHNSAGGVFFRPVALKPSSLRLEGKLLAQTTTSISTIDLYL